VIPRLDLHPDRLVASKHTRENLLSGLDQSLSPARLLGLECGHFDRKLSGAFDILAIDKLPALELRTIGEIGIFGQRVVLPAASVIYRLTPPDTRSSVEIKKYVVAGAARVFEHKMAIEQNSLYFGQERVVAIDVRPARLH